MKKVSYSEIDPIKRCVDCNQPLKKNLLIKNPNAKRCNVCHKLSTNNLNFNRKAYQEKQRNLKLTHK